MIPNIKTSYFQMHRFCVAPMMDGTDRHCRYFHRLMTRRAYLYTEMITAGAIVYGDQSRLLAFDPSEHPVALQLGGCSPSLLAEAAKIGADLGYDEINLNVGCPSDRVQSGAFGASLMKTPERVADCVADMIASVAIPVTVKCRIGVDDQEPEQSLFEFVDKVGAAGCRLFIVHARKAWLDGLSAKDNRTVPPLDYALVRRLKKARPDLAIIINGGVENLVQALDFAGDFDGVMLGRAAYGEPYLLAEVDRRVFGDSRPAPRREEIVAQMSAYVRRQSAMGVRPHAIARHMLGLYHGVAGARRGRYLSEKAPNAGPQFLDEAAAALRAALAAA
jgi:tRNA-dihydrouridine synthase A